MERLDLILSIIDIVFCTLDIGLICYLFFYRFPPEVKKNRYIKFRKRQNRPFTKKLLKL